MTAHYRTADHTPRHSRERLKFRTPKWWRIRADLYRAADFRCADCGWRPSNAPADPDEYDGRQTIYEPRPWWMPMLYLTVDHIVPVIAGGTKDISNLQVLCSTCNLRKEARVADCGVPRG